ncbi:MAG: TlpA family protein disulfide reductase [Bacteroidota bacterium]|nr:TlpA family protein disulfide reductase [Bacteroidota bacterium]
MPQLKILCKLVLLFIIASTSSSAQTSRIIKWPELESLLNVNSDTTYVINFWATWCKPCIKELPYFDNLASTFAGKKIKVVLVSLDFKRQYETVLKPYLVKNNVVSEVLLIDEPDYNSWIDKIDTSWNGAIPATLILNNKTGIRNFYEREFTLEEINNTVKPLLP